MTALIESVLTTHQPTRRMPTRIVIGTSMFQIAFITAAATIMHAVFNNTVDVVLALVLLSGGVIGAEFGAQTSQRLGAEQLRLLLGLLVLFVSLRLAFDLVVAPREPYSLLRLTSLPAIRSAETPAGAWPWYANLALRSPRATA